MKFIKSFNELLNEQVAIESDIVVRLYSFLKELYSIYGDRKKDLTRKAWNNLLNKHSIYLTGRSAGKKLSNIRFELLQQISPTSYVVKTHKDDIQDLEQFTIQLYLKFCITKHSKTYGTINKISKLTSLIDKENAKKEKAKEYTKDMNKDKIKNYNEKAKDKKAINNITLMIQFLTSEIFKNNNNVDKLNNAFKMFLQRNNFSLKLYLETISYIYLNNVDGKYEIRPIYLDTNFKDIAKKIYDEIS